jgi:predicted ABC-type exoprotein transport system permease subunit
MKKLLPDVMIVAGALCVSYGAWLAWHPAGFIVIGSLAIVAAIKLVSN